MLHLPEGHAGDVELEHEKVHVVVDVEEMRATPVLVHLFALLPH